MAAKRRPGTELNHDNWADEEEPEEKGEFRMASEEELKHRVIKTARRRNPVGADKPTNTGSSSVFAGFSGFSANPTTTTGSAASSVFSFLNKTTAAVAPEKSGNGTGTTLDTPDGKESIGDRKYDQKQLKALNQKVSEWIKTHVDQNPMCILTPIFRDYEKYLKEIESKDTTPVNGNGKTSTKDDEQSSKKSVFDVKPTETAPPTAFKGFSFGSAAASTPVAAPPPASTTGTSLFGGKSDSTLSNFSSAPKLSFGTSGTASSLFSGSVSEANDSSAAAPLVPSASTGFSFGGAKPFSFGVTGPPVSTEKKEDEAAEENDDDEPPKVEFKPVVEEDSVFSKRCKVFFKLDGNFQERGIGTIFVKPVKDSPKHQMIVRADTSLGNVLVNLVLVKGMPIKKMGSNNVMLVCVPNADFDKPVSVLLKVKAASDADEVIEKLESFCAE